MTAVVSTNHVTQDLGQASYREDFTKARMAGFVITYKRAGVLVKTLNAIASQTRCPDVIAVIDNGKDLRTEVAIHSMADPRFEYYPMAENLGPAGAAHFALSNLAARGYSWIYWGDDDNPPPDSMMLEQLLAAATAYPGRLGAIGAVGALLNFSRGRLERLPDDQLDGLCRVDIIGGGQQMLVSGDAVRAGLLPRPELFFGFEELSLHMAFHEAGYDVVVPGAMMREMRRRTGHLGLPPDARTGRVVPTTSLWREYYSTRNMFYLLFHCSTHRWGSINFAFRRLCKAALGFRAGPRYGWKLAVAILSGLRDGLLRRMGRRVEPPVSR